MTALPIPFLSALLLLLLAASNHQQLTGTATGRVYLLFLYLTAVGMLCIGFRWSHNLTVLLPIAAALFVAGASLLYLAFCSLGRHGPVIAPSRDWPHLIPLVLVGVALIIQPLWIEPVIIVTKLVYTGLLVNLARKAPESLKFVRLNWLKHTYQALWGSAALLVLSVCVDIAIIVDFALNEGRFAAHVVGIANLGVVLLLGWASVLAGQGKAADEKPITQNAPDPVSNNEPTTQTGDESDNDAELLSQLNRLLVEDGLYADTELNLQKLARKAGVPTRVVSQTINSQTGKNISQWVNSARIEAACDLLNNSDISVTQVMMDVGFLTKSNFNREFRRLKGCSPSQWRKSY